LTETHRIEYKQILTADLEKEAVAFLNSSHGGKILLGLDNTGVAVGLSDIDSDALKIKDRLKNIAPSILGLYDLKILEVDKKPIIELIIASGPEKPYHIRKYGLSPKGCFIRVGTAAEPMTQGLIDKLYSSRTRSTLDKIVSNKQQLEFAQLKIYYQESQRPLNDQFATNLELVTPEGKYNYNAYLLSDINTTSYKLAKYAGTERSSQLIGNNEYGNSSILTAAKKLLDRLDIENETLSTVDGDRTDQRLWNPEALREAVRNALVHNDYSTETFPKFEIFEDRLEITTYGGLPVGLGEDEFFSGYSAPRNKVLMRVFRDVGLVESLGIGIPKILETYDRSCFEFSDHFLRLSFPIEGYKSDSKRLTNVKDHDQLTDRQKEVLELISANPKITRLELASVLGINTSAIQKHIVALKEKNVIERNGGTRGFWIIKIDL